MAVKVRKRRWTDEELELLQQAYADPEQRAVLPEVLGRSLGSIRDKVYRLRKTANGNMNGRVDRKMQKSNEVGREAPFPANEELKAEFDRLRQQIEELRNEFTNVKLAFEELADELQAHMTSFGHWLIEIGEAYVYGVRPVSVRDVMAENRKLQFEMEALRKIIKSQEDLIAEQLRELELLVEQFTHLSSMAKIASLGDFIPRLRTVVSRFGEVLQATIELPALTELEGGKGASQGSSAGPAASGAVEKKEKE